jgi:hypothetical protein
MDYDVCDVGNEASVGTSEDIRFYTLTTVAVEVRYTKMDFREIYSACIHPEAEEIQELQAFNSTLQAQSTVQAQGLVICRRVRKIAKIGYQLRHVRPSLRPHGTTRLTLDEFS